MGAGNLVTKYIEKAEKLPLSFLLFTNKICPQASQLHKLTRKACITCRQSNWSHLHIHNPETRTDTSRGAETSG